MSSEIIKAFTVNEKTGEVWVTSYSSNSYPKTPRRWRNTHAERILAEQGRAALDNDILQQYREGVFRGTGTDYAKCLAIYGADACHEALVKMQPLKKLKAIVTASGYSYAYRFTKRGAVMGRDITRAKVMPMLDAMARVKSYKDLTAIAA